VPAFKPWDPPRYQPAAGAGAALVEMRVRERARLLTLDGAWMDVHAFLDTGNEARRARGAACVPLRRSVALHQPF
jgi:hypothetical protein